MADRKPLVLIDGIPQGVPSGDIILVEKIRASSGILFGSDTADANKLSDYEEADFSPAVSFGGGSTGITYGANNLGTYTKIGRLIVITGYLELTSKGSSTGNALLYIPISRASGGKFAGAMNIGNFGSITYTGMLAGDIATSGVSLFSTSEAGTRSDITHANFSNDAFMSFTASYFTA